MSKKIIITTFTDPMMGLSWECEPMFRKLETHFAEQIEFRNVMALLVRNVQDFMMPDELALAPAEGIRRYNARLAKIYESEEPISGMPINMTDFRLFDEAHTTSLPLNLAYHAAKLTDAEKSDLFLYNLRYATIVDCRPTTQTGEVLEVARKTGIDSDVFLRYFNDGSAQAALEEDLRLVRSMSIRSLPAYLLQYDEKAVLLQSFDYYDFVSVIEELTDGKITPKSVEPTTEALRELLRAHPLISPIEIKEAFEFSYENVLITALKPMQENQEITILNVGRGCHIKYHQ